MVLAMTYKILLELMSTTNHQWKNGALGYSLVLASCELSPTLALFVFGFGL